MESRLGDRSKSSSLESALGPSCFVGVLGAAPLKLGRVGDELGAREGIVDFRASAEDPLNCIKSHQTRSHETLQLPLASSEMAGALTLAGSGIRADLGVSAGLDVIAELQACFANCR